MRSSTAPRSPSPGTKARCGPPRYRPEDRPLAFGVHGAVAEHYGTDPKDSEPHATTLDYLVAAAAG